MAGLRQLPDFGSWVLVIEVGWTLVNWASLIKLGFGIIRITLYFREKQKERRPVLGGDRRRYREPKNIRRREEVDGHRASRV